MFIYLLLCKKMCLSLYVCRMCVPVWSLYSVCIPSGSIISVSFCQYDGPHLVWTSSSYPAISPFSYSLYLSFCMYIYIYIMCVVFISLLFLLYSYLPVVVNIWMTCHWGRLHSFQVPDKDGPKRTSQNNSNPLLIYTHTDIVYFTLRK